jgi:hypothetical protein
MGVYSDVLAPPNFGFWFVVVVGLVLTLGPVIWQFIKEANLNGNYLDEYGKPQATSRRECQVNERPRRQTGASLFVPGQARPERVLRDRALRTSLHP